MKIKINKSVISKSIDDVEMLLNVETGLYHELNESGSLIWSIIKNNNASKDELIEKLNSLYPNEVIDIDDFLDELQKSNLIEFL